MENFKLVHIVLFLSWLIYCVKVLRTYILYKYTRSKIHVVSKSYTVHIIRMVGLKCCLCLVILLQSLQYKQLYQSRCITGFPFVYNTITYLTYT